MPTWRDDKILELANQLTYSPTEKRREQLSAAIALLPGIDPKKTYPWDFVHFRITSFQPRAHIDHVLSGDTLRADLATLIEFLSDTLSLRVEDAVAAGDSVFALEDVSRKFNVSSKTIQRWRKQGLIALRYVYPDGRRRLGFLESAVAQFAAANKERVDRSATFKQLTDEEKTQIIAMARPLAAQGQRSIKDVACHIARVLDRAPETIRYTIRKYDREHPESAIFTDLSEAPTGGDAPVDPGVAATFGQAVGPQVEGPAGAVPLPTTFRLALHERALKLKAVKIEFTPNPLFEHPDAENIILHVLPAEALARAQATVSAGTNAKAGDIYMARLPRDLPAFLQDIFRQPVMPHELETDAFRRMNYLKSRAAGAQLKLNPESVSPTDLADIETLLMQASDVKNQILQSNLRIAVHVARKHQRADRPLIELVSDATIWLMRALEKYDFSRPVRFSTYASYAIMKNFARDRVEQLTRRDTHLLTGQDEILNALGAPEGQAELGEPLDVAHLQSDLLTAIQELPDRERELLASHFGLDQTQPALSLAQIGDKMGITKARVRQLEARALRRLRHLMDARGEKLHRATLNK